MPFDVLPHHNIHMPQVQFYHPDPRLAEMVLNARGHMYDTMLKGLDTVLGAVDPLNIAKRREAMMQADYQSKLMPLQLRYMEQYGMPMPKTPQEAIAFQNWQNQRGQATNFSNIRNLASGGGGTGGPYAVPAGGQWNPQTGTETTTTPLGKGVTGTITVGPLSTDEGSTGTQSQQPAAKPAASDQTITGAPIYDDQGNVLPPEQQVGVTT